MERSFSLQARFEVLGTLGRGARGAVLRVRDRARDEEVALKVLTDPSLVLRNRFPTLAAVRHPAIVALHDWFDDVPGFTMAIAPGLPILRALDGGESLHVEAGPMRLVLGQRVESPRFRSPDAVMLARIGRAFGDVAAGLQCLHDAHFVHGDVRPENVMVREDGAAILIDVDGARPAGTPGDGLVATTWAAPELDGGSFTPAADVYALGTVLFQALTGDVPFGGSAHDVVLRKGTVRAPSPSFLVRGIPSALDDLCAKMLERAPARRATLSEVRDVLGG